MCIKKSRYICFLVLRKQRFFPLWGENKQEAYANFFFKKKISNIFILNSIKDYDCITLHMFHEMGLWGSTCRKWFLYHFLDDRNGCEVLLMENEIQRLLYFHENATVNYHSKVEFWGFHSNWRHSVFSHSSRLTKICGYFCILNFVFCSFLGMYGV